MEQNEQSSLSDAQTQPQSSRKPAPILPPRRPLNFGQTLLASSLGVIIATALINLLSFFILIGVISSLANSSTNTPVNVLNDTFLKIDLTLPIQETAPGELESMLTESKIWGADDILACIEAAKTDNRIKGIYIRTGAAYVTSWGLTEELRNALIDFRKSGKPVIIYGESYSQTGYYLATAANTVYLHPEGMLDFRGIGAQAIFYKDLFDKLDVHVDLIRPTSCSYKSAGETYTMNHMSEANREQIHVYINSIWQYVSERIAQSRKLTVDSINSIADNLSGYLAKDALSSGLIDKLSFENDVKDTINSAYGGRHILNMSKYIPTAKEMQNRESPENQIAVIYAEGNVMSGSYPGYGTGVYGNTIVKALNDAANNSKVKAIVLRVNSPGGAATASETMTNAVIQAKKKKPVIVSMSDLAASAGYEISCMATKIVAQPTTITGSIGVFGTIPEIGTMLKKKIGITIDTAQTNRNSTGLSIMHPLSPTARNMMQRNVENFYVHFVARVAEGRGRSTKYIDSIARGRVWTGRDALRLGLVDTLGGMPLALNIAAAEAGINNYLIVQYPSPKDLMSQLKILMKVSDEDENSGTPTTTQFSLRAFLRSCSTMKQSNSLETRIQNDILALSNDNTLQARLPYILILN